jgi:hypothetical protein
MAVINLELPMLLLLAAMVFAVTAWLLGTFTRWPFTHWFSGYRYRIALGSLAFAVSGLMGFFSSLKLEISLFGDWLASHPVSVLLAIAYTGYVLFGFLGCWTAVRIGGRMDSRHTLSVLYSLVQNGKQQDKKETKN